METENPTQNKGASVEDEKPLQIEGGIKMTETQEQRHIIDEIYAMNGSGEFLQYTDREDLGYSGKSDGLGPSYVIHDLQNNSLRFSFSQDRFLGIQDIDTLKRFLGEDSSYAEPFSRRETRILMPPFSYDLCNPMDDYIASTMKPREVSEVVDRTLLRLKEQFGEAQFPVLETYPQTPQSIMCGAFKLVFKIARQDGLWGIITATDIIPESDVECFGIKGYKKGNFFD